MAIHAPITGAPTRAPNSAPAERPRQAIISDIQMLLSHSETLLFAAGAAFHEMGGFSDIHQRNLVGHADNLTDMAAKLVEQMHELTGQLEVRFVREGR